MNEESRRRQRSDCALSAKQKPNGNILGKNVNDIPLHNMG